MANKMGMLPVVSGGRDTCTVLGPRRVVHNREVKRKAHVRMRREGRRQCQPGYNLGPNPFVGGTDEQSHCKCGRCEVLDSNGRCYGCAKYYRERDDYYAQLDAEQDRDDEGRPDMGVFIYTKPKPFGCY